MRGRRAGSSLYLDVHIEVGPSDYCTLSCFIDLGFTRKLHLCDIVDTIRLYFYLQVDPLCSVSAAHYIGENVRHQIHKVHPEVAEVFIHIGTPLGFTVFLNSCRQTT